MPEPFQVLEGDALSVLRSLPSASFDGCLTDPPYGLGFMGKAWDGCVPPALVWAEARRVLKPGASLLAFGGTRTFHRLTCAIEDGGFAISDCVCWLYGQGFPKSLDISKAIDKAAGAERFVVSTRAEHNICRPEGGGDERLMTSGGNREVRTISVTRPATADAKRWDGYGTALKPAWEPIVVAMRPTDGTFAENALKWGVAGLSIGDCRIPTTDTLHGSTVGNDIRGGNFANGHRPNPGDIPPFKQSDSGRWPANVILDEEAAAALDEQSGILTSGNNPAKRSSDKHRNVYAGWKGEQCLVRRPTDSGGASRFFYCAKASGSERGDGNTHPTVKPLKLTEYLARLILPPAREGKRRLLVPFSGSGSEMIGALSAGWDEVVGIEINPEYAALSRRRIEKSAASTEAATA